MPGIKSSVGVLRTSVGLNTEQSDWELWSVGY
jgi:hypothetical protein